MQFKLLNFHKFVGNFATSLVGTFIPLIIYKTTGSLRLSVLFMFGQCFFRLISNHIFRKLFARYPQVALLTRTIPLIIYNVSLLFLEDYMVVCVILITISYGMSLSFKNNALGILFNYSSQKKTSKNLVFTRIVESISAIVACVAGGLFIDWNQTVLIIFSLSLYIASVLPLFIYFIFNKAKVGFNKDFTSNAAIAYDQDPDLKQKRISIVKQFANHFFIFYALFCIIDYFTNMYTLHIFVTSPTFAMAGYLSATFQVTKLLGLLLINIISKKFDMKKVNFVFAIIGAIPIAIIPFIQSYFSIYLLIGLFGFAYELCSYFMMNSLLTKCKLVSGANRALFARQDGINVGQMVTPVCVMVFNSITPAFFVMVCGLIIYAIYTLIVEEKLRRKLVNYLENNEIE